ncbi:Apoptosis-inducing factor 3, partial [Perkinsus olseni]
MLCSLRKAALDPGLSRVLVRLASKRFLPSAEAAQRNRSAKVTYGAVGAVTAATVISGWASNPAVECEGKRRTVYDRVLRHYSRINEDLSRALGRGVGAFYGSLVPPNHYLSSVLVWFVVEGGRWVEVGDATSFQPGEVYHLPVEEGHSILLARSNRGRLYATGSKCTYKGCDLKDGLFVNDTVTCPKHDAAYDIATGVPVRGPGLEGLCTYRVEERRDGKVYVDIPKKQDMWVQGETVAMAKRDPRNKQVFAIVGGGAAAASACEAMRQNGYTGRIVMVTREAHLPYDRPELSKRLDPAREPTRLYLRNTEFYEKYGIEVLTSSTVVNVDTKGKNITIEGPQGVRSQLDYDKCLYAAGADPVVPDILGSDADNVHYLRTAEDATRIADSLRVGHKVLIIGSGFIAMEMASALENKGLDIAIVGHDRRPLERILGRKVARFFSAGLEANKMKYYGNSEVRLFRYTKECVQFRSDLHGEASSGDTVNGCELTDGEVLAVDVVIVGIGADPNTEPLKG